MPAFPDMDGAALTTLFAFLGSSDASGGAATNAAVSRPSGGPVVASGGAPGGLEIQSAGARYSPLGGPDYPDGVDAPARRYYTNWGLYPDQPYVIGPPWSSIVAFDLNNGTIKWKVPLGEDATAAEAGAKDAGVFMAEHHGMIVTAAGLLFVATTDGKVRAYDEDNGKVLWTANLPAGSEGMPAMYQVNGRQYLVVPASSKINSGGGHPGSAPSTSASASGSRDGTAGYVAFALPQPAGVTGARRGR
jgi:quinoprotein glucose dehydrogenase